MGRIIECVMNVSEGRVAAKWEAIAAEVDATDAAWLLSCSADADHHRCVLSFIGTPPAIAEAAWGAARKTVQLVDLRKHRGVHPRIGAVDVISFIPVRNVGMETCRRIAHRLGERIARQLEVPVYLHGQAASVPERRELSVIRRGQFEGLAEEIKVNPDRKPDFGPSRLHPTAGAAMVGARRPLIAYNVYLNTPDVRIAQEIAARVRESGGGLEGIRALGFYIRRRHSAQVSMNVTDHRKTPLLEVFERVEREARRLGARARCSEIVGLVPEDALDPSSPAKLKLENFCSAQILEKRMAQVLGEEP